MSTEATTTTTVKPAAKTEKVIDYFSFLDNHKLTRAERSYYEKHYKEFKGQEKTIAEWAKIIKFIHT